MAALTASATPTSTLLDSSPESATTALYRAAIGPANNDYYLLIFTRFEAADRAGPSWNWAASLYTLNWMVFRQLWRAALIYVSAVAGAVFLLFVLGHLLLQWSASIELGLLAALGVLSFVAPGVYGNAILHAASRQKMALALSASNTMNEACAKLNREAGSRRRFISLALVNMVLAGVAVGVYMTFSSAGTPTRSAQKIQGPLPHTAPASSPVPAENAFDPVLCKNCPGNVSATSSRSTQGTVQTEPTIPLLQAPPQAAEAETAAEAVLLAPKNPVLTAAVVKTPAPKHYYINVGLFAKTSNARNARSNLLVAGMSAFTQEIKTIKGKRTRLRVGPFGTEAKAKAAAKKIIAIELDAVVFQKKLTRASQIGTPI